MVTIEAIATTLCTKVSVETFSDSYRWLNINLIYLNKEGSPI